MHMILYTFTCYAIIYKSILNVFVMIPISSLIDYHQTEIDVHIYFEDLES